MLDKKCTSAVRVESGFYLNLVYFGAVLLSIKLSAYRDARKAQLSAEPPKDHARASAR